jgi:uncharacterized damage-inducible protein DinB
MASALSFDMLVEYAQYNYWANERLATVLEAHPDVIDIEIPSSFPTLRRTVNHMWDAETIWLKRLQGVSLDYWPSERYGGDGMAFVDLWLSVSGAFITLIKENGPSFVESEVNYKTTAGKAHKNFGWEIIMHILNHGTYHRGQLVTMLRHLGVDQDLPSTDFIYYLRDKARGATE